MPHDTYGLAWTPRADASFVPCDVLKAILDLKLDSILVTFEDQSAIEDFLQGQNEYPMARKVIDGRMVYLCNNDFEPFEGKPALKKMSPRLTGFGLAVRGDQPGPHINPIQRDQCHTPEALLGTGWSYCADIWNSGIMVRLPSDQLVNRSADAFSSQVWDLLAGRTLFQEFHDNQHHSYSAQHHLAK